MRDAMLQLLKANKQNGRPKRRLVSCAVPWHVTAARCFAARATIAPPPPQHPPDVVGVVADAELPQDHPSDAFQRPQFVGVAIGHGPFQQQIQQPLAFVLLELPRSSGNRLGRQGRQTALGYGLMPPPDGDNRCPYSMGHVFHAQPGVQQFDGSSPSLLQCLGRSMWSHAS